MLRALSQIRFQSGGEAERFRRLWLLERSSRLFTTFTWLMACDERFRPTNDDEEARRRAHAVEKELRPALGRGYAQLLTEPGIHADVKDTFAFYLPEALAFGALGALREAFPQSAATLRDPELPRHFYLSFARLISGFGHDRVPGSASMRGLAAAGRCGVPTHEGQMEQMRERARAIASARTRPQRWLTEQLQPGALLDGSGTPRTRMPDIKAARAEAVREQLSIGEAALSHRSCSSERGPKLARKPVDINAASPLLLEWMRATPGARAGGAARPTHTIRYTDTSPRAEQRRLREQAELGIGPRRAAPGAPPTYREIRRASARRSCAWVQDAARVRERVASECEGLSARMLQQRESLEAAEGALDERGRHEVANLLAAMRRMDAMASPRAART
eukprot:scaffold238672_cov33-Tisochrysis_lutea.AAC.2